MRIKSSHLKINKVHEILISRKKIQITYRGEKVGFTTHSPYVKEKIQREYIEPTVAINSLFQMKRIGFLKDKNYNLLKKKCMSSIVQYIFKS